MFYKILKLYVGFLILFLSMTYCTQSMSKPLVIGYWSNWSTYKDFSVGNPVFNEQMKNLNVLAYSFFEVDVNGSLYFSDVWSDLTTTDLPFCNANPAICHYQNPQYALGNFTKLTTQKLYPNIKIIISVGGAGHDESFYSAFANPANFVNSLVAIVNQYKIDGIDLDFEPSVWGGRNDPEKYTQLVKAIRLQFPDHHKFMITAAVSANPVWIKQFGAANWKKFTADANYLGIMVYDLHGGFDGVGNKTAFHSNLYSDNADPYAAQFSADSAVKTYLQMGVSANQLILGIPAYGRVLGGVEDGGTHGLYQPFTTLYTAGDLGNESESYKDIIGLWIGKGYTDYLYSIPSSNLLSGSFAYNPTLKQFVSYDSTALVDAKAIYVKQNNLGGMMLWELRADISPSDSNNASLLKHIFDGMNK
jgi:chitinase